MQTAQPAADSHNPDTPSTANEDAVEIVAKPSQWLNASIFLVMAAFAALILIFVLSTDNTQIAYLTLVIPAAMAGYYWLCVHCISYTLGVDLMTARYGVFDQVTEDLELYRVRDYVIEKPLLMRMVGLGNLVLTTADDSSPIIVIRGLRDVEPLQRTLRERVEQCRKAKGVRELDLG